MYGGPDADLSTKGLIDGIWKDDPVSMNFFIQSYADNSALILVTPDLNTIYSFIDTDITNGIDVMDLAGGTHHLSIVFTDATNAFATLTVSGGRPYVYPIAKTANVAATPKNHGVWKDSCASPSINYFLQTYDTGSAIVIATVDLSVYYVFLDEDHSDGINEDEYSGKPAHLNMTFGVTGSMSPIERCTAAPVTGSTTDDPVLAQFSLG